jgi:flagellar motor protein MotB
MAAGGGGAWKVAYADFVTAMMAFFLVMWLVGQDQKVKKSVADYFSDPLGGMDDGSGKKPINAGSTFDQMNNGKIPDQEGVQKGRGSNAFGKTHHFSEDTKMVHDWMMEDQKSYSHWKKQALQQFEVAKWSEDVQKGSKPQAQVAARMLANQMAEELRVDIPKNMNEIHRKILLTRLAKVNWEQIAQVMLDP